MGESKPSPKALQAQIREVAYLLWEAGERDHGRSLEYWLAAERELLGFHEATGQSPADPDAVHQTRSKEK